MIHRSVVFPQRFVGEASASNGVARAEKVLDGAVAQLAAADVAARPVARLDFSLAAGILRARRELLGTDVIVGLSERTTAPEFFFGSMLKKLLDDREYTLLVSRCLTPLNTCNRVLLVLPPVIWIPKPGCA